MTVAMRGGPAEQPPGPGGDPSNNNTGGDSEPPAGPPAAGGSADGGPEPASDAEPEFPVAELARLEEMISRPRWVIPVLPGGELEVLLNAAIDLCKRGLDTRSEPCQRFFRDGLTTSFTKILTDDAVSGWKFEIHKCISKNCERLIELCVTKLNDDWFCLLDLLAMVFNPQNKFHTFNSTRASESVPPGGGGAPEEVLFARPPDPRMPRGWLVDLINLFGSLGGFRLLLERFQSGRDLTVITIFALIRPVGMCYELLTVHTIEKYILPIVEIVPTFLEKLSDDELKKEAKNEAKNDALSSIVKLLKGLAGRAPGQEDTVKSLEMFRLKMILRLLQISSFNGKMNALNEVNKVIGNMANYSYGRGVGDDDEWLTADKMAEWIKENKVLQIVLRDSLHQPQYVEKLEKIIRFIIKEKALTLEDLDSLWAAQSGKHEAIVKNVHDLLAKLAWDFSPEQLDHLFGRFQASWANATKKQRERLLELIRRLAEDDKDGVMAHKVLNLLWSLAHSDDVPTEIMDQALSAHMKILDYSCSQDRDAQKTKWLDQCVEELKSDKWVLPTLKQIRDICCLYQEAPPSYSHTQRNSQHGSHRHEIINQLQSQHSLVVVITENLTNYVQRMRELASTKTDIDVNTYCPDGRYNHMQQIEQRLNFLRFLLKDGQLWLCAPQAHQIWSCLAERAVFPADREVCFKWFSKLMGDEPDLDPNINQEFFKQNILQLDPALLTESGIKCFDKFFKAVNQKAGKLVPKRRTFLMEDEELIGLDYIWRVVMNGSDEIANKAIELLREVYTNLGPQLQTQQKNIHADFIANCMDRLRASYDTLLLLERERDSSPAFQRVATVLCRVLKVLREYIVECDKEYGDERVFLPLFRAYHGKHVSLVIRLPAQGRSYDFTVESHTQETLASVRRRVLHKVKASPQAFKVELYINGDTIDHAEDKKCIGEIPVIRDETVLTAKLCSTSGAGTAGGGGGGGGGGGNMPSSPDSSSDSSAPSPQHPCDGPNVEAESGLPGVILSQQEKYVEFLLRLADLGCRVGHAPLRDAARSVLQMAPAGRSTVDQLQTACQEAGERRPDAPVCSLEGIFFSPSPAQVLYSLEVLYSLLMPADGPLSDKCCEFHRQFLKSGGGTVVLDMLNKNNFLSGADLATRRLAFLTVLRLTKLVLSTVGFASAQLTGETGDTALQQAVILPGSECTLRNVAITVAQKMGDTITSVIPELGHIQLVMKLVWASSCEQLQAADRQPTELRQLLQAVDTETPPADSDRHDLDVCREGLETFSVALCLRPDILEALTRETYFQDFIVDLVLICRNRVVRVCAAEQFSLIAMRCSNNSSGLIFFINLLFSMLNSKAKENAPNSQEYFQLLCRLLECACHHGVTVPGVDKLLHAEIAWLQHVKERHRDPSVTEPVDELLMEGHLRVTRELLAFLTPEQKLAVGSDPGTLVTDLLENFLLTNSVMLLRLETTGELPDQLPTPICYSAATGVAAFDVLVALCTGCVQNLRLVVDTLIEMYYSDREEPITEWEYTPPVGKRPAGGFVGLKNAGATCYMNSVLQQLYMIERVRTGVLAAEGACTDPDEDFTGEERADNEIQFSETDTEERRTETQRDYNIGILKWLQAIFGHLAGSKLQYYIPRGLWKHFKLQGEPVNLREQHDAIEFFISLVDSVDEALKALSQPLVMSRVLGGTFSDQKICKQCPHRYSKEDPFTVLNVDIRNFTSLTESLDQYVKGDLLEGANAYHCDKCNRKVDTVKRTCIKKLPPTLCIQLKRFDYDWERECAIKFNDYFEFPRQLDMEPYTVRGLARIEGELIDGDPEELTRTVCSTYELTGIVVHSGQASGGHYYSYILHRNAEGGRQWYKFDDYDVSECRMEDDEEMKTQCFGGEYVGEMMKRMSSRRQKRWWNAYILFYTRTDTDAPPPPAAGSASADGGPQLTAQMKQLSITDMASVSQIKMPAPIQRSIRRQNIRFLHTKNQFFGEFVQFIRKLVGCNSVGQLPQHVKPSSDSEQMALMSVQLAARFLFTVGLHMKKAVRGPTCEWYEALLPHLTHSAAARSWLAQHVLFVNGGSRFCEYLLECPSSEVRSTFAKLLVLLARHSTQQPAPTLCQTPTVAPETNGLSTSEGGGSPDGGVGSLSEAVVHAVLGLLKKDVAEHGRHLPQYFSFFLLYASCGIRERTHLLKLQIPATLMLVALEEGPGPPIKFQYADLSKLYQTVALLVRCCDISSKMTSSQPGVAPLPNPHGDPDCPTPIMPIQPAVDEILFTRASYLKKIIEDAGTVEETGQLLRYCTWENPAFSSMALTELLWQISYSYNYELRPYLELLLQLLLVEDSWQTQRILNALKGTQDEREGREGLFDTIQRFKNHYQKRAYQCIKCLVELFSRSPVGQRVLHASPEFRRKWYEAVDWLKEELDRRPFQSTPQYGYTWSPPTQSNETSNGYFLERSHSALMCLEKADELCPEEPEGDELEEDSQRPAGDPSDPAGGPQPPPPPPPPAAGHVPPQPQPQPPKPASFKSPDANDN
ncbi:probable ubiquitin carboxyl-terminal hydrolase FAF-X isoform X2 [Amphibalanus amphitrite]|uniref:probable ubiquitin carboxyl-terminal hydrolase FAF-X isoform X2 n=1 Tax=Amphibalanus amphitrite TaxID=1232801 RepID=UPI001C913A3A|nr:probable ubiquitin carboxyl-terminal hydrolase FAF-X isoform X2 [Amphibalanus amphitrite]